MGMFTGPASKIDLGALPTLWTLTGPIYIVGGLLFGIATFRAGILPRWAGVLLAVGTAWPPSPHCSPTRLSRRSRCRWVWPWPGWDMRCWQNGRPADDRGTGQRASDRARPHRARPAYPSSHRRISLTAGVLYLLTFVSIPTLALYGPVKGAHYVIGSGPDTAAIVGGLLEIIVALAGIGTAVVLFPMLKKQNESARAGPRRRPDPGIRHHLRRRGVPPVDRDLAKDGAGADALVTSHTLVALYDRIFLLGQSFMPADMRPAAGLPAVPVAPRAPTPFP